MAMNYEFERHLQNARARLDNRAIEAWLNLSGLFNTLKEGGIVQELPVQDLSVQEFPREVNMSQEPLKIGLVESSPLMTLRRAKCEKIYKNRHQSSVGINGQLIRQARVLSKLSQKELGRQIGVSQAWISEIEQDVDFVVTVGAITAIRLNRFFQIDIGKLVPYPEDIERVKWFQLFPIKENFGEENKIDEPERGE